MPQGAWLLERIPVAAYAIALVVTLGAMIQPRLRNPRALQANDLVTIVGTSGAVRDRQLLDAAVGVLEGWGLRVRLTYKTGLTSAFHPRLA
jgi:hypothetical protein